MMKQDVLIKKITDVLQQDEMIHAAWLCGSFGRGDADDFSDVDVLILADEKNLDEVFSSLRAGIGQIDNILYSKTLSHSKTINAITEAWLRFDLTVLSHQQMKEKSQGPLLPLFGQTDPPLENTQEKSAIFPKELTDMANEFLRVLGLTPVVMARHEFVVAQTGTNIMRDLLIKLIIHENDPQLPRGALSLSKALTREQMDILVSLPPVSADKERLMLADKAIASAFLFRGRKLAEKIGATWPDHFEEVTLSYLERELGMRIETGGGK